MSNKINIIANYIGQGWSALIALVFIPIYVTQLGIEAYAMVGVFNLLFSWMAIVDFGLTPTINREMARAKAGIYNAQEINNLLYTFEIACIGLAIFFAAILCIFSPWVVIDWLKPDRLAHEQLINAMYVMAIAIACRWLEFFYRAILLGLQDAVWLNAVWALLSTIRFGGACLVLFLSAPTLVVFFFTQVFASLAGIFFLGMRVWKLLPKPEVKKKFSIEVLIKNRRFTSSMFFSSILAFSLSNVDKIIISKILPLEQFGYYTLATTLVLTLSQVIIPMNISMYPRFTELVAKGDTKELGQLYLKSCRMLSTLLIPPGLVFVFLASAVLFLWTNDISTAKQVAPLLSVLTFGTLCNGLMNLPYMLQLAHGWVGLSIRINLVAVVIIVPLSIILTTSYGALGAALCWALVNFSYVLVGAHFMHKKILLDLKWFWYKDSVIRPLLIGSVPVICCFWFQGELDSRLNAMLLIMLGCSSSWLLLMFTQNSIILSKSHEK